MGLKYPKLITYYMKKTLSLILLACLFFASSFAQSGKEWQSISLTEANLLPNLKGRTFPSDSKFYRLDLANLRSTLFSAPEVRTKESSVIVSIPNQSGNLEKFRIWEDSNFAPELQAQFPNIKAYTGTGIDDLTATLRISIAPNGIETMILRADKETEFIEPLTKNGLEYASFTSRDRKKGEIPFTCGTRDIHSEDAQITDMVNKGALSNSQVLKKFRLALSCTAEYTAYHGGSVAGALAAMNATMTRVNGIYEIELAVKLELIAGEASIIYTNASTDPYSDSSEGLNQDPTYGGAPDYATVWNIELQNNLTATIGEAAYDIGHLFGAAGGGGNAGCIGCVCQTLSPQGKGSGYTSPADQIPEGDTFDVDYVAHEMGHQLGANHTFSYAYEGSGVQVEVGSGSTIMAYAGVSGSYDYAAHSQDNFVYKSIQQIQVNLANKACAVNVPLTNTPPTISAGADFTIPKGTPFVLTGTGSDAQTNSALQYTWEQNDSSNASAATTGANSFASATKTVGPIFRPLPPTSTPVRYFPSLANILSNTLVSNTEALPNVARTLNFVLTGRDHGAGGGQTSTDATVVTVLSTAGPFNVTSQAAANIAYPQGSTQTVTWTVNSTATIAGAANVSILLSTDGGQTYPTTLVASTPNNGTATVTMPNINAPFCRIMVKPTANIFFDVNTTNFSIGVTVTNTCSTFTNSTPVSIPDGVTSSFATSSITVPAGNYSYANVGVNITHAYIGDLYVATLAPGNVQVDLFTNGCSSNVNLTTKFSDAGTTLVCASPTTGTYKPTGTSPLSTATTIAGQWTLGLMDVEAPDAGTLNSWFIEACSQTITPLGLDTYKLNDITLYPNPTKGMLNISVPTELGLPDTYSVYNNIGQTIESKKVTSMDNLSVNTSAYSNGVYFIKITKSGESKTLRFIKN